MKKQFKLKLPGKNSERLVEAIKHEIRQYIKREKRKILPENASFWDFDCKFGNNSEDAQNINASQIIKYIDTATQEGSDEFYLEILARACYKNEPA